MVEVIHAARGTALARIPPMEPLCRNRGRAWIRLAALFALLALPLGCAEPQAGEDQPQPGAGTAAADSLDFAPGYVGSAQCASCHEDVYRDWKESLHSKMEQPATPQSVRGIWSPEGTVVPAKKEGRRIVMIREGDKYFIEAPNEKGEQQRYPIARTIGNRYKQRYLTRFDDGSWHALPIQWFEKDGKFVEWHGLASGEKDSGHFWTDTTWQWQLKCAGCHTTGLDVGYDATTRTYATRWKELAIGCEACHGPGQEHVDAKGGKDNILCPSDFTLLQQLETCGKCHSRGSAGPDQGAPANLPERISYPYNMLAGGELDDHFVQVNPEDNPKEFWPDGASFNHHQQFTDYRRSSMLRHGRGRAPSCTTCHEPHRAAALKLTIEDNALCLSCHEEYGTSAALAAHTGHGSDPVANPGARCVECHMPRIVNHAGSQRLRSHTYWNPDPRRLKGDDKTPGACLLCHTDKDRTWSLEAAAQLWPNAMGYR